MHTWTRINAILLVLTGVLLALHLWPQKYTAEDPLTDLDPTHISMVRIERGKQLSLSLQRVDNRWQIDFPTLGNADPLRVGQLLAIAGIPVQQRFPAPTELAQYGLQTPVASLQLDKLRVEFGDRDATQQRRYVLINGQIAVIDDVFFNLLGLPASHYSAD